MLICAVNILLCFNPTLHPYTLSVSVRYLPSSAMLSPNPLSLFCLLLLCFPLAVFFTATTNSKPDASQTPDSPILNIPIPTAIVAQSISFFDSHHHRKSLYRYVLSPTDDDDVLCRVAARVKAKPKPPRKIAFLFLTTTPLPFAPLWEAYFSKAPKNLFNIYVHADPRFSYDPPFSGVFSDRIIPSKHTERYSPTLTAAARRLLAHALIDDPSNYMFALLSAACIPLHSFNFTYNTLIPSAQSFIEILKNEKWTYARWAARGPDVMLPEVKLEDFRIGSQFWALTRKHARLVVSDQILWSKFKLPCVRKYSCYPEENYFPTLLSMWDPKGCVPATLTHVDWTGRVDGHPRTYNATEVGPELVDSMRKSIPRYGDEEINGSDWQLCSGRRDPFLFARKFAPDALQPLMSIANGMILKD
ncbi:glycosyltransferase BC10 [Neltuma alba]|uniref:glycosyltransferase BC10 n=1 Tax=Neltuma alba TaxID=207710 RepID=UPI0010A55657|nr:glycosyltransferase BC10 [Prosopis alba]